MLRNFLLLLIFTIATGDRVCPKSCKCSENSAICNDINFTSFERSILTLKISQPHDPLIIKEQSFNVTGLKHLNSISIEHASILDIAENSFIPIPALSSLNIINSNIPRINSPLIFAKAHRLRILQISNSALRKFESIQSDSLEELDLSRNHLKTITEASFANLSGLTFINLEQNEILSVHPDAFKNLLNLQDIILAGNNITNLSSDLFRYNEELVSINLSENPLKQIDFNLEANLEKLVLSSCQLENFGEKLAKNLILLNYLDLSNNTINLSPGFFNDMKELEYVDLSNNHLTSLDPLIFQFNTRLQKIILDNNLFSEFPEIQGVSNFETYYFSCKNCGISKIFKDSFKLFPHLVHLHLSHNKINGANLTAFRNLRNLVDIDLSYNNISVIDSLTFANLTKLTKINLAGNPLKVIDSVIFQYNRELKTLDVSSCGLRQLWKSLPENNLNSLLDLNIANNLLTSISTRDLQVFPFIQTLDISNNPLNCNEVLKNTLSWLTIHNVEPVFTSLKWKTHEELNEIDDDEKNTVSWKFLVKDRCSDANYFDIKENKQLNIDTIAVAVFDSNLYKTNDIQDIEKDYDDQYNELYLQTPPRKNYSFLWPTLVFIFTALSVLVVAANALLLLLRTRAIPRHVNVPHIKIPGWSSNGRLKKHSGSVYQPLSEERPDICSITKNDYVPTHTPKSTV